MVTVVVTVAIVDLDMDTILMEATEIGDLVEGTIDMDLAHALAHVRRNGGQSLAPYLPLLSSLLFAEGAVEASRARVRRLLEVAREDAAAVSLRRVDTVMRNIVREAHLLTRAKSKMGDLRHCF